MSKKIGLALSGGGAWSLASLGILIVLEENNIKIDYIAGCSSGALVGAAYASQFAGQNTISKIIEILKEIDFKNTRASRYRSFGWYDPKVIGELFEKYIGKFNFEDLRIPLTVVTTDFRTGKQVLFNSGPLTPALVASSTLTLIYTPYEYQGKLLTDGGLANPLPTDVVRDMGAELVLAIDSGSKQYLNRLDKKLSLGSHSLTKLIPPLHYLKTRHFGTAFFQLIDILFENFRSEKLKNSPADILFIPNVSHHNQGAYNLVEEFVKEGEKETKTILPKLRKLL